MSTKNLKLVQLTLNLGNAITISSFLIYFCNKLSKMKQRNFGNMIF